jgi:hypothetical protein
VTQTASDANDSTPVGCESHSKEIEARDSYPLKHFEPMISMPPGMQINNIRPKREFAFFVNQQTDDDTETN